MLFIEELKVMLILVLALCLGCDDAEAYSELSQPPPEARTLCTDSGGHWKINLRTCWCPDGNFFSLRRGCFLARTGSDFDTVGFEYLGDLLAISRDPARLMNLSQAMRGLTVEGFDLSPTGVDVLLGDYTDATLARPMYLPQHDHAPPEPALSIVPIWNGAQPEPKPDLYHDCERLVSTAMNSPADRVIVESCRAIQEALFSLQHDAPELEFGIATGLSKQGTAEAEYLYTSHIRTDFGWVTYNVRAFHGIVTSRILRVGSEFSFSLTCWLSATGGIWGGTARRIEQ